MGKTSSAVKYKYNQKAYKAFNVQIKPELFDEIDCYCKNNGLSRSQFLKLAIDSLKSAKSHLCAQSPGN